MQVYFYSFTSEVIKILNCNYFSNLNLPFFTFCHNYLRCSSQTLASKQHVGLYLSIFLAGSVVKWSESNFLFFCIEGQRNASEELFLQGWKLPWASCFTLFVSDLRPTFGHVTNYRSFGFSISRRKKFQSRINKIL